MTRTSRPTRHKEQQPQRSVTATNLISAKGNFVVAFSGGGTSTRKGPIAVDADTSILLPLSGHSRQGWTCC
jgi:hypothetical protein